MIELRDADESEIQPGFYVGDADDPDLYRLEREVGGGGEGAVWLATSPRRDGDDHRWAIKILHARNIRAKHDESAADALERWYQRSQEALHLTSQLQHLVPGVVGPSRVFRGAPPHRPGAAGCTRTLFAVSPWIDRADITKWLKQSPTFEQVCAVASGLAAIVDGIADNERLAVAHRDISPANVLVDAGTLAVSLIDFTWAVPPGSGPVTAITNAGYTAPEARNGQGSAAADRYSFGGVVFYLLTGRPPAPEEARADCYDQLLRASFPAALAAHVSALLAVDAIDRPPSLVQWTKQLVDLSADVPSGLRYADLDLAIDGFRTAIVSAVGGNALARAWLGQAALWTLVPDSDAPTGPVVVRSVVNGIGDVVEFVIDNSARVLVRHAGCWQELGKASVPAGLAVVPAPNGSATAYIVDPSRDQLAAIEVGIDGTVQRGSGPYLRRVLAATIDHDGIPIVAATSTTGELVAIGANDPQHMHRLGAMNVRSASVGISRLGEPVCIAATGAGPPTELTTFEQRYGHWLLTGTVAAPGMVHDLACVGQRDGLTLAVACNDGVWITSAFDGVHADWKPIIDRACHRLAVGVGPAWRLQLAAITDGEVVVATEDFAGNWSPSAIAQ
ncbi:hypothetical protein [Kribbella sp. NPDC000426]|uniref:protein kinase domain-containing protein n=1 Tax=Kribbella sp. NPDC000426 TaxID=3154255 RepID=UPI0033181398